MTAKVAGSSPVTLNPLAIHFSLYFFYPCSLMDRTLVCEINGDGSIPSKIIFLYIINNHLKFFMNNQQNKHKSNLNANEELLQKHRLLIRQRIDKERSSQLETMKQEFLKHPLLDSQTFEERQKNKKRLLNYVHRYVFLQQLEPVDNSSEIVSNLLNKDQNNKVFLNKFLFFRNFFFKFFNIKSVLLLFSCLFFFSIEYFIHYHSSFSFNDINVTYETIINKIPPFF